MGLGLEIQRHGRLAAIALATVAGAMLAGAAPARADGLWDQGQHCINAPPADWTALPGKLGDQFVVKAPSSAAKVAKDVADEIRSKDFIGYYETHLKISAIGFPSQPKPYQVFVDPQLNAADGVTDPLCNASGTQAIDINANISNELELHVTAAHELFHAAQAAIASTFSGDWWVEATAEWAPRLFYTLPTGNLVKAVTNHPDLPMDAFNPAVDGAKAHQYGAWSFVAWMFSRGKLTWADLRDSFTEDPVIGATNAVNDILDGEGTSFGEEVASYWADHTNQKPSFGPTGKLDVRNVSEGTNQTSIALAPKYGARLPALRPAANVEQLEVIVPKVPAGVEVWIRLGERSFWHLDPGTDFDETFCRAGATPGSLPLPTGGEARLAITTTSASAPTTLDLKTIGVSKPCPKQLVIHRGKAVGPLHLGMDPKSADQAVPKHHDVNTIQTPLGKLRIVDYSEASNTPSVVAYFLDGRIEGLFTTGNRFATTDGITAAGFAPGGIVPGNTLSDFGGDCHDLPHFKRSRECVREGPKTRFTVAIAHFVDCNPPSPCPIPPDYYIGHIAVGTEKGLKLLKLAEQGSHRLRPSLRTNARRS